MNLVRRSAIGALATTAIVLAGPAISAHASAPHFQTLATTVGGKVQACRVPTTAATVTIKMRVDARKASGRVSGLGSATHNGTRVGKEWDSGWVRRGHVSKVGTVKVPRGAAYALDAGIGTANMGNGATFKPLAIRTCG